MKIAVMGAGAVGSFCGALLAKAGNDVTLIARPRHVEAIRRDGLVLERATGREAIAVDATADPAGIAGAELVLFCVKSQDTEEGGQQMLPHLGADTTIWSLQNGVDNAERLSKVLGRMVVPTVVYVATEMAVPGHVKHHGRGDLVVANAARSEEFAAVFAAAGIPVVLSDRVIEDLWTKLIINCAYNAISAITQRPYGELIEAEGVRQVMADIVAECRAVAMAAGIAIPEDVTAGIEAIARAMPNQYASTAQDIACGKPTEIDHINGYVVRKGAEFGIATPVNQALLTLVKLIEKSAKA